jgi:hypothetical protein
MSALGISQKVMDSKEHAELTKWTSGEHHTIGDALDAFCEPVETKYFNTQSSSDVEGMLWTAWQAVVGKAAVTPYGSEQQHRLVDFVTNLAFRPTLSKDDQICKIDDMTVWRDLPVLGWEIREAWNFGLYIL